MVARLFAETTPQHLSNHAQPCRRLDSRHRRLRPSNTACAAIVSSRTMEIASWHALPIRAARGLVDHRFVAGCLWLADVRAVETPAPSIVRPLRLALEHEFCAVVCRAFGGDRLVSSGNLSFESLNVIAERLNRQNV